jgi:hypothetical protein
MKQKLRFQLEVAALEIARGHDGLLKGRPEPVLLVGVYMRDANAIHLLGRSLHRFRVPGPMPCVAARRSASSSSTSATSRRQRSPTHKPRCAAAVFGTASSMPTSHAQSILRGQRALAVGLSSGTLVYATTDCSG